MIDKHSALTASCTSAEARARGRFPSIRWVPSQLRFEDTMHCQRVIGVNVVGESSIRSRELGGRGNRIDGRDEPHDLIQSAPVLRQTGDVDSPSCIDVTSENTTPGLLPVLDMATARRPIWRRRLDHRECTSSHDQAPAISPRSSNAPGAHCLRLRGSPMRSSTPRSQLLFFARSRTSSRCRRCENSGESCDPKARSGCWITRAQGDASDD